MSRSVLAELGPAAASVDHVREVLGLDRPVTLTALLDAFAQPVVLDEPIVTAGGVALGGHHRLELSRDGSYRYRGYMRATGVPSFTYLVRATVSGQEGPPAVLSAQGVVHGTNEPGDRESPWDQPGTSVQVAQYWLGFRHAQLATSLDYDTDWLGVLNDWVAGLIAATTVFGNPIGFAIVLGSQLADALDDPGLAVPGLTGVIVAGGAVLVLGPGAIAPAIVAGIGAAAITAAMVHFRAPHPWEKSFAEAVFGPGTIPWEQVQLTNLLGVGRRAFTIPAPGNTIIVNLGAGFDDPINYTGGGDADADDPGKPRAPGHLFIHELTHVWQIAHSRFIPGWICDAVTPAASNQYAYGPPGPSWKDGFNTEQQATIVEEWFAGNADPHPREGNPQQKFAPKLADDENPYYRYIRDNIRRGVE